MGAALYRKYRSLSLDDVVGQDHIVDILERSLSSNNIHHAYLLTGPKGVGKTSVARIIAHKINNLEYSHESQHIDIIEIDAASNRRIDEMRELRDKMHTAPALAKYKVYIIDEVHMLTKEAFNALLKSLEEPPEHVIFILATTDVHKLPETIISRCMRFHFKSIDHASAVSHLRHIATTENIDINDEALELLASHGDGSFRDSIGLLDQASSLGTKINKEKVQKLLGIAPDEQLDQLLAAYANADTTNILNGIDLLIATGVPASQLAKQCAAHIRKLIATGNANEQYIITLQKLIEVPVSSQPQIALELALLASPPQLTEPNKQTTVSVPAKKPTIEKVKEVPPAPLPPAPVTHTEEATTTTPKKQATKSSENVTLEQFWPDVLEKIKSKYNTLYSVLRMAHPFLEGDTLRLSFAFPFHQKRLQENRNKQIVAEVCLAVCGHNFTIESLVDTALKDKAIQLPAKPTEKAAASDAEAKTTDTNIETISNIFGSAEVLE